MTEPNKSEETSELARAMAAIPDEPLLPVEKKLIAGSLLLGLVLLGVLLWLSQFFPTDAAPR
jgi:predicted DNA repair protein MutK